MVSMALHCPALPCLLARGVRGQSFTQKRVSRLFPTPCHLLTSLVTILRPPNAQDMHSAERAKIETLEEAVESSSSIISIEKDMTDEQLSAPPPTQCLPTLRLSRLSC